MPSPSTLPRLVGMVHLGPLPGSPGFDGDLPGLIDRACRDAETLTDAGFDALGIENFGDAPFYADDVPTVTVATMTAAIREIRRVSALPVMVNVLRNDGLAALAVAAATGAEMVRINVLSGSMWTDQGLIHGRAAEVGRLRTAIAPNTSILADVFVKHAIPPPGTDLTQATLDLVERGGADAVVVSGSGTGRAADLDEVKLVAAAAEPVAVYVGSGVDAQTATAFLGTAHGVIVGSALKRDGLATNPVDAAAAASFVTAAGG